MQTRNIHDSIDRASKVVLKVLEQVGGLTPSTKVVKLVYLVDYTYFQFYGETLSGLKYQWDHYGPNALDHAIVGHADSLVSEKLLERKSSLSSRGSQMHLYRLAPTTASPKLSEAGEMIIKDIVTQYGKFSVDAITRISKKTAPFANAEQYDLLQMEQTMPVVRSQDSEWSSHLADLQDEGTVSLEQLVEEYG